MFGDGNDRIFRQPIDRGRLRSLVTGHVGIAEASGLGELLLDGLERAILDRDGVLVEALLILGSGSDEPAFTPVHTAILEQLLNAGWHFAHEDLVSALESVGGDPTLPALFRSLEVHPEYLARVEGCAGLHRRIVWAIAKVGTPAARAALRSLAAAGRGAISAQAEKRLADFDRLAR